MRMIHIAGEKPHDRIWSPAFVERVRELGELVIVEHGNDLSKEERFGLVRGFDVALTNWGSPMLPSGLADDPGKLRYICHISGTVREYIPPELIASDIPVTNWGDAPAGGIAQAAMALLICVSLRMHARIQWMRDGKWRFDEDCPGYSLSGMAVGVYGFGVIGRRFAELLRPYHPRLFVFDPYTDSLPDYVTRVSSLDELVEKSFALVIHAGLNDETRGSVSRELLARLPRHGIIINTARGAIIDQEALFEELEAGRLWAGLDVIEPDTLPPEHPARRWENLILTAHRLGRARSKTADGLERIHVNCLENLERFKSGAALRFVMDRERYLLST